MHHKNNKRGCHAHDRCCGTRSSRWKCNGFRIDCCLKNVFFEEICFWDIQYVTYLYFERFCRGGTQWLELLWGRVFHFFFNNVLRICWVYASFSLCSQGEFCNSFCNIVLVWNLQYILFLISHNHWRKAVEFLSVSSFTASSNRFKITISHFNLFNSVIFFNNFFQVFFQLSFSIFVCVGAWIVKILIPIDICFNFSLKIYLVKILSNLISRFLV